jgi:hypothetical protein
LEGDSSSDESLNNSLELNTKTTKENYFDGDGGEEGKSQPTVNPMSSVYSHECL